MQVGVLSRHDRARREFWGLARRHISVTGHGYRMVGASVLI